jgi:hypothetical protein
MTASPIDGLERTAEGSVGSANATVGDDRDDVPLAAEVAGHQRSWRSPATDARRETANATAACGAGEDQRRAAGRVWR